ncbi:MAG TPA: hypothetical protein VFY10_07345 [Dehalococcoidia bacterium]|nr:hypothetical protein [Dehalococcoidia bacterium]
MKVILFGPVYDSAGKVSALLAVGNEAVLGEPDKESPVVARWIAKVVRLAYGDGIRGDYWPGGASTPIVATALDRQTDRGSGYRPGRQDGKQQEFASPYRFV